MGFFRSTKMSLYLLMLHIETAFDCMIELGYMGSLQFMNIEEEEHAPNLMFTQDVRRCFDMQQIIDMLEKELADTKMEPIFYPDVDTEFKPLESDLPVIEKKLRECDMQLGSSGETRSDLSKRKYELTESRYAIMKAHTFLTNDNSGEEGRGRILFLDEVVTDLMHDDTYPDETGTKLHYLVGTIPAQRFQSFKLMLYRFFGMNVLIRYAEIPVEMQANNFEGRKMKKKDRLKADLSRKYAILLMNVSSWMRPKLLKICISFSVNIYKCPESPDKREELIYSMARDIDNINVILEKTEEARRHILENVRQDVLIWKSIVKKASMAYVLLNKLDIILHINNQKYLHAECWLPYRDVKTIRENLKKACRRRISEDDKSISFPPLLVKIIPKLNQQPPTHFQLNKFTRGFQNLVDSYGIANYRELNPAPYTIITFPFLFAIMFGDVGHGTILIIFAMVLILKEKKIILYQKASKTESEIFNILFAGRYIILLMGLFSTYCGLIYNEFLSKSIKFSDSSWRVTPDIPLTDITEDIILDPSNKEQHSGHPYIVGMDPIWDFVGESSIITFNSFKMKAALIVGITQMLFGLILSAVNALSFRKYEDLFLVVIPQIIFMLCLFVYLVFLMIYKWLMYGGTREFPYNCGCAPQILIIFIDMILFKETDNLPSECNLTMYSSEKIVELTLVLLALTCVPILLAGKPIFLIVRQKKLKSHNARGSEGANHEFGRNTLHSLRSSLKYNISFEEITPESVMQFKLETVSDVVTFDMSEIWIHSGIHTIECVLGSISHTASYLRLWALSLAHDQLSNVLWSMVFNKALKLGNGNIIVKGIIIVPAFFIWSVLTVAIMVAMEGLSAFLHTLRLHWVEFQSKFYVGAGTLFVPFRFEPSTARG